MDKLYLKSYGDIELQRRMVSDRVRTDAFAAAIKEVVKPGDTVLDIGTGTGILAMLAAQAGARQVYGVDATSIAKIAKDLVKANGLSDTIQIHHCRANELQLDHKVDVIISEWLGNAVFVEGMLQAVLDARDEHLAASGYMLPAGVRLMIAPLDDPLLYHGEGPGYWRERIHGLDFSSLQEIELSQGRTTQLRVDAAAVLAPGQAVIEIDLHTVHAEDVWFEGQLEFVPVRDGILNGFCVWFEAQLSPRVVLDTGPFNPETHWYQTYMSFVPRAVRIGERLQLDVGFSYAPDPADSYRFIDLSLAVDGQELNFVID